jgi:hypothetical protein
LKNAGISKAIQSLNHPVALTFVNFKSSHAIRAGDYPLFPLIYVIKSGIVIDLMAKSYEVSKLLIFFAYCYAFLYPQ